MDRYVAPSVRSSPYQLNNDSLSLFIFYFYVAENRLDKTIVYKIHYKYLQVIQDPHLLDKVNIIIQTIYSLIREIRMLYL